MQRYNPKDIEPKWQAKWADDKLYQATDFDKKPKFVMLTEFPYPSGDGLHMGHIREYTYGDILARQKRMQGHNVLYPMGYDAFGLPTENYAIKNKISPQQATDQNIATFQRQFESLGYSIDWSRAFRTSDPDYYRWTQWLFLQFFKAGLAYQDEIAINWCPHCKTGLSNEEVINGRHERCDTLVEKKVLKQWMLKITDYADRLLDGLKDVDYPPRIADQQINWIGRSDGANITFSLAENEEVSKPNFVILHGFGGSADTNFIPKLRAALEKSGYRVQAPQLPHTDNPVEAEQVGYVLDNCKIDENTILVGHSLGGGVAMKVLEKITHPIRELLLVAPAIEPTFNPNDDRPFYKTFDFKYDYEDIASKAQKRTILSDTLEAGRRKPYLEYLSKKIDARLLETTAQSKHFTAETEPFVLQNLVPSISVFTTAHDTIYGVTFMVLAPEHELVEKITTDEHRSTVNSYIKMAQSKTEVERQDEGKEKTGVFTGAYAINPINGAKIPIWIADYVLAGYGTGAIMAVPGEDARDYEFANKYKLPIIYTTDRQEFVNYQTELKVHRDKYKLANSDEFNGLDFNDGRQKILDKLVELGVGEAKVQYRLRDWIFSRQHYWGEPIPVIHCPEHGAVAVPDDQLPVELPKVDNYEPTDNGESPLAVIADWVNTTCPTCGQPAKRETDTMPNWAGSSWYYLRYYDPHNDQVFADPEKLKYWGDVDLYLGGMEHTTLHLLYSRFWHQFFYDQKLVPTPEPYAARRGQGIILAADGSKMSKSKGNVVNPTDIIDSGYGADALRLAIAFLAPYDQTTPWGPESVAGPHRFLQRVWTLVQEFGEYNNKTGGESVDLRRAINKVTQKVSEDLLELNFNTAIAALMECVNELYRIKTSDGYASIDWSVTFATFLQLLAPFAPHISEELWQQLSHEDSIHVSQWPQYDEKYLVQDTVTVVIQVNGKLRGEIQIAKAAAEAEIVKAAQAQDKVAGYLDGQTIRKTIYVPGKLVNFVI